MTEYNITEPVDGSVTLVLGWRDAEVLTRVVGMANSASLMAASPMLHSLITDLVAEFGRNSYDEAENFVAEIKGPQVYIMDVSD